MNTKLVARMFRKMADGIQPMHGSGYETMNAMRVCYDAIASVFEADLLASGEVNCLGCLHGRPMVTPFEEPITDREFAAEYWSKNEGRHLRFPWTPGDACQNYRAPEGEPPNG